VEVTAGSGRRDVACAEHEIAKALARERSRVRGAASNFIAEKDILGGGSALACPGAAGYP
jgi:hypothetical protein